MPQKNKSFFKVTADGWEIEMVELSKRRKATIKATVSWRIN